MKIKLLSGKDIVKFYATTKITSCMTGKKKSARIKFYADNPDKVQLVSFGKNKARALLWTCDSGKRILDDVYCLHDDECDLKKEIESWKSKNGIKSISENNDRISVKKFVKTMPYLDSFEICKDKNKRKNQVILKGKIDWLLMV